MRRATGVLLLVVVLGACGGGNGDEEGSAEGGPPTGDFTTTAVTAAPGGESSTPGSPSTGGAGPAGPGSQPGTPGAAPTPPARPSGPPPALRLTSLGGVTGPTAFAVHDGDPALYVTEQSGRVRAHRNGAFDSAPVADIADRVRSGGEQGLLGIAFKPGGGHAYLYFTRNKSGCTNGEIVVAEYPVTGGRFDVGRERVLLTIDHCQFSNHDGGQLAFGPDRMLYIAVGDGGSGGDPFGNAQNKAALLGKILRIDPGGRTGNRQYGIPPDNPFAGGGGAPEVWAFGLRNPWRMSFDRATGEQWIADVGQNAYEEVNVVAAGRAGVNYGWNLREGRHAYRGGDRPPGAVDPVIETSHSDGACSITGGFVYRGTRIAGLGGRYLFSDYCDSRILAGRPDGDGWRVDTTSISGNGVRSFGEDASGELYVLDNNGLKRIDPA